MITVGGLYKNIKSDYEALQKPVKELADFERSIIYIMPYISVEGIDGKDIDLIRKFYALSYLNQIDIRNIIRDFEKVIKISGAIEKIFPKSLEDVKKVSSRVGREELSTAAIAYHIFSREKEKLIKKSEKLNEKLKQIISTNPYYKKYQAVISFKDVYGINLPLIIGTTSVSAPLDPYALGLVLFASIVLRIPLNSTRNLSYLKRILTSKTVSEILRLAEEAANEEGLATKAKEKLKKISSLLEKRIRSTKKGELLYTIIAGFVKYLSKLMHYVPIKYQKQPRVSRNEIEKVINTFMKVANIHFYAEQLSDRFHEYVVNSYLEHFSNIFRRAIRKEFSIVLQEDEDSAFYNIVRRQQGSLDSALREFDPRIKKVPRKLLVRMIKDKLDDIVEFALKQDDCNFERIGIKQVRLTLIKSLEKFVVELKDFVENRLETLKDIESEPLPGLEAAYIYRKIISIVNEINLKEAELDKLKKESLLIARLSEIIEKKKKKTYFSQVVLTEEEFKKLLKAVGADFVISYKEIFNAMYNDINEIMMNVDFSDIVNTAIELVRKVVYEIAKEIGISGLEGKIVDSLHDVVIRIGKPLSIFLAQLYAIIICRYLNLVLALLDVTDVDIDMSRLRNEIVIPNYLLIVNESLLKIIAFTLTTVKENNRGVAVPMMSVGKIFDTLVDIVKIPSVVVVQDDGKVRYRFAYMKRSERVSLSEIRDFVEKLGGV
jgi:hypothetical protein